MGDDVRELPAEQHRAAFDLPSRTYRRWLLVLLVCTVGVCFYDLGGGAGFAPTDCWVAQTAREMRASGDYLVPRFAGETRMQKSPGPYWAVIGVSYLLGRPVDELSARVPNAVLAVVLVLTVVWLTRSIAGRRAGLYAGLTAASSVVILSWSHRGASDLGLAALIAVSLTACWRACNSEPGWRRGGLWLAAYFVAGLGMLYKMPMPMVCVGLPMVVYVVARRRWDVLKTPWHLAGLVVFCLPWLPWAIAVLLAEPTALAKWRVEYVDRFTGDLPNIEDQKVWYFYLLYLLAPLIFCLPYSISIPGALVRGFQRAPGVNRDGAIFLLVWFFSHFAFFTASAGKELRYFLPALPPLLALLGIELQHFFDPQRRAHARIERAALLALWLLIPAGVIAGWFGLSKWTRHTGLFDWSDVWPAYAGAAAIFSIGAAAAAWLYVARREVSAFGALVLTMWTTWLWAWPQLMPILVSQKPYTDFAQQMRTLAERTPAYLGADVRFVGFQDSRIIWYGDLRIPRVIDQLELLERQGGRRSRAAEERIIGEEMIRRLEGPEPVLFVVARPEYVRFLRDAPPELERAGRAMPRTYLWVQTRVGDKTKHFVCFGNRPPPWPEPPLTPPSSELRPRGERVAGG